MSFRIQTCLVVPLLVLLSTAGCATFQDQSYEMTQRFRTEAAFFKFWLASDEYNGWDYKKGWKAGYYDVVTGGDGTPPLIAPHNYWSPFQILWHCDQKRQNWYLGFQDGAMVASQQPDTHYLKLWVPVEDCPPASPPASPPVCPPVLPAVEPHMLTVPPEPSPPEPSLPPTPSAPGPSPAQPAEPSPFPKGANSARLLIPPSPEPSSGILPASYLIPPEPGEI